MKNKFLIPVLAMIFATGMSFTTTNTNEAAISGYVEKNPGNWVPVQVDCQGPKDCLVRFLGENEIHQVFATMNRTQPIKGSGDIIVLNP